MILPKYLIDQINYEHGSGIANVARNGQEDRMKRWMIAGALAFAAVGQAFAADLPPAPPPPRAPVAYIPVVAPVYNWGGIYFGINGGYGFGKSEWTTATAPAFTTGNFNIIGYVVGADGRRQFPDRRLRVRRRGRFRRRGARRQASGTPFACRNARPRTPGSARRARVGYAADRVLFYGTGGGAFGNISADTAAHVPEHEQGRLDRRRRRRSGLRRQLDRRGSNICSSICRTPLAPLWALSCPSRSNPTPT